MAGKNIAVSGTYRTGGQAELAVSRLKESGFGGENITRPVASDRGFQLTVLCSSPVSRTRAENLLRQMGAEDVVSNLEIAGSSS